MIGVRGKTFVLGSDHEYFDAFEEVLQPSVLV